MGSKFVIYIFIFIGGTIGGYIPLLWHDSFFSFWSVILSTVGGLVGVFVGYKINQRIGG
ncbi:hypothetical protein KKC06_03455 [Patescibacteria group bacterium]|nr:hypothetical protein [Patescibacteria group bacterium]